MLDYGGSTELTIIVGMREYDIVVINVHGSGSVRLVPQPNLTP